jgi:hypothetical protein
MFEIRAKEVQIKNEWRKDIVNEDFIKQLENDITDLKTKMMELDFIIRNEILDKDIFLMLLPNNLCK